MGMAGGRRESAIRAYSGMLSLVLRVRNVGGCFRDEAIGTLSLIGLLILVFQLEVLIANHFGHSSVRAMLEVLPVEAKIILAAILGPFLHQGSSHLVGNLGVLLVAGTYIEHAHRRNTLYAFYGCVGYLACWAPLVLGSVGAVGASGVTYGLGAWMMIHAAGQSLEMANDGKLVRSFAHVFPFLFGLGHTTSAIDIVIRGAINGADDITHIFGVFLGLIWGVKLVLDFYGITLRYPSFH